VTAAPRWRLRADGVTFTDDPSGLLRVTPTCRGWRQIVYSYAAGERSIEAVGRDRKDLEKESAGARYAFETSRLRGRLLVTAIPTVVHAQGHIVIVSRGAQDTCLRLSYALLPVSVRIARGGWTLGDR